MNAALAEAFPVGEMLADELEARGWSQAEFASILSRPAQFVSEIISGKKEITRVSATQIAAALGTSAQMWLTMQDHHHLWLQAQDTEAQGRLGEVRLRARLATLAPIGVLRQRGLIQGSTPAEQEIELKALYRIDSIHDEPALRLAARRSTADEVTSTQLAWLACVRQAAEAMEVKAFDRGSLEDLAGRLTRLTATAEAFGRLPALFADVGVRLVFVESFPGSKMDGCSMLVDGIPTIGISGRGKRLDKVLFTILHEVAHIWRGDLDDDVIVIDDPDSGHTLGSERPADTLAASWVLPLPLPTIPARINQDWVTTVANEQGIHPIVLVGRLQNEGRIPWRTTLTRNAPTIESELAAW